MPAEQLHTSPNLTELLRDIASAPPLPVSGIASDSRKVSHGYLFLACSGIAGHGMDYLDQAIERGAIAVAFDSDTANAPADPQVPMVAVPGLGRNLGDIAKSLVRQSVIASECRWSNGNQRQDYSSLANRPVLAAPAEAMRLRGYLGNRSR